MDETMSVKLKELFETKLNRAMRLYLETCSRCGICIEACHVYASMPETKHTPVGRSEVIRKLFKRYFKLEGRIAPWLGETIDLDDIALDKSYEAAFSCTGCRRCVTYCPFGIDTQQIMSIAKLLLVGADREPKILSMLSDMSISKGETWEQTKDDYRTALGNLKTEVEALAPTPPGRETIPLDVERADVLYVALSGKHSIVPAAAVMNAARENWCLSYFEAVNFGAFLGDPARQKRIAERIIAEAARLVVKEVAVVECGTAFRVLKYLSGHHPFRVVSIVELVARYLREGRIRVDPSRFKGSLTYHDPCQIARNGGVLEDPRYIIRHLTPNFVELTPSGENNWCCGGGGGLVSLGEQDFRMKSSRVKADQLKASGAATVCTACENCHTQLSDLNSYYNLNMKVESLVNLTAHSLVTDAAGSFSRQDFSAWSR